MLNAMAPGEVGVQLIELKQSFNMIADETNWHHHQCLHSLACESFDFVFEIRLEPGHLAVA